MKRDKYFEAEKRWLALDRRLDELQPYTNRWRGYRSNTRWDDRYVLWEPLEKPVFAGWDVSVTLSESGLRRRDAVQLLSILNWVKSVMRIG